MVDFLETLTALRLSGLTYIFEQGADLVQILKVIRGTINDILCLTSMTKDQSGTMYLHIEENFSFFCEAEGKLAKLGTRCLQS